MSAIFYILLTGCQWNALPRSLGASVLYMIDSRSGGKQVYSGVCGMDGLSVYDRTNRIDWKWQAMDGVITKAPLGGKKHRTKSLIQTEVNQVRNVVYW